MKIKKLLIIIKNRILSIIGSYPRSKIQVKCKKELHGSEYGGWTIYPDLSKNSIVYSFGVGNDISFDLSIIKKFSANVYAFDPTPISIKWIKSQKLPKKLHFYSYGIADYNGTAEFNPPENPNHVSFTIINKKNNSKKIKAKVATLKAIMKRLKHKEIDLLKIDIEGAEYKVIPNLLKSNIKMKQILVEFHHHFKEINGKETEKTIKLLNRYNYKIFNISPEGYDYSFIKN